MANTLLTPKEAAKQILDLAKQHGISMSVLERVLQGLMYSILPTNKAT